MELIHGSLFAGIGGFDLGFAWAGFTTIWQVEINDYCRRVLAQHFPHAQRFVDIHTVGSHNLQPVDVLTGGFPCQPVSCAGQRRGTADDRWLWPEMRRVLDEVRPRWVVAENVPGLITMGLDQVLTDLEALGYTVGAVTLPACAVGAPHRRERVFILARTDRQGGPRSSVCEEQPVRAEALGAGQVVADSASCRPHVSDDDSQISTNVQGQQAHEGMVGRHGSGSGGWWDVEPDVGRVAHGVPHRVDRLRALGNAVVPQLAEELAWMIRRVSESP